MAGYRRLGLPFPPAGADLVRLDLHRVDPKTGEPSPDPYAVGFRVPPAEDGGEPTYWIGRWITDADIKPADVQVVAPTPDAFRGVRPDGMDDLCFAVHCAARGWDGLADAAYRRAWDATGAGDRQALDNLRVSAWNTTASELAEQDSDRKQVFRRLTDLSREYEVLRTAKHKDLLRKLALTVAPRTSKPGSVESLIDDLTEYWTEPGHIPSPGPPPVGRDAGHVAYWKLVDLGFDAVPALLDHVGDERLTRGTAEYLGNMHFDLELRVGHLVGQILGRLADGQIDGHGSSWHDQVRLDPGKARAWWAAAQKMGEREWLVSRALSAADPDPGGSDIEPNPRLARVLRTKYPEQLAEVYRALLRRRPLLWSWGYAAEVGASTLPPAEKVAVLSEGAGHARELHRAAALDVLLAVDPPVGRKLLRGTLEQAAARKWACDVPARFVFLVERSADTASWDALAAVTRRATPHERARAVLAVDSRPREAREPALRRERLRFLAGFLDDREAEPNDPPWAKGIEVRGYAAAKLAGVLWSPARGPLDPLCQFDPGDGPLSRLMLREAVRAAAARELTAPPN
ncbi:MAG: hypothetical protein K2X82_20300 [Gemmataceae bacterium]|nr:hypothetical protein [Gemmataceae bacterium]